ncbi:Hvo_1808 family surface protein [Halorubrum gandharaense]
MRRVLIVLAVTLLAVGLAAGGAGATDHPVAESPDECADANDTEIVGCWAGIHYGEDPGIDQSDGLTEAELEELTHLKMARVEYLRDRPFTEAVPVDTVTREEFQADYEGDEEETDDEREFNRWNDGVWKALFVVGEDDSSAEALDAVFGGAVAGFYSPAEDRVVLVVDEDEALQISGSTLVHELAHAMQDQYHDLADPRYAGDTQDADLAVEGIVEGEVVLIEELYDERCAEEWACIGEPPADDDDGLPANFNYGILQTVLQPYSDGPFYAESLREEGGWEAVNASMNDPPATTSETIHRDPDYETAEIEFEDVAEAGWETFDEQGVDGAETAGEASMFVMFWYQSFEYEVPTFEATWEQSVNVHLQTDDELRTRAAYNYADSATDGWAGDELYPYRNDGDDEERDGYVWETEWQTEADATEFLETYERMLAHHDPETTDEGVRYVADGDFRGAYGVEHDDTTVRITHAPDPESVMEIRPTIELEEPEPEEPAPDTPAAGTPVPGTDEPTGTPESDGSSDEMAPGFGVVVALVALLCATVVLRTRD